MLSLKRRRRFVLPSISSCLSHLVVAFLAFFSGVLSGAQLSDNSCHEAPVSTIPKPIQKPVPKSNSEVGGHFSWPDSMRSFIAGAARVPRDDFMKAFDLGVPLDPPTSDNEEVLLLYGQGSIPTDLSSDGRAIPPIRSAAEATKKCNIVKQVLLQPGGSQECFAVVGQWESYHVHKWLRVGNSSSHSNGELDPEAPLQIVARSHTASGRKEPFPRHGQTVLMGAQYGKYLSLLDELYADLKPIAAEVAARGVYDNTVIVLVCNKGQSMLLANLVCSAKARGMDAILDKVLLFASDLHTERLAKNLGLTTYHHGELFADMPEAAAKAYGDTNFKAMMMAKIYVVHLINLLGHDVLFQDVDVIWFKDPLEYFQTKVPPNFDLYFQDDGQHSWKYAPYSPNTGFYFVKQNIRTRFLLSHLVRIGDVVANQGSHQGAMTTLMNEHSSWRGLRVKTIHRDEPDLPCGFHYHHRQSFMKEILTGKTTPYVFHMSWTDNKDSKIKFFQQLGEWYWREENHCGDDKKSLLADCCLSEPLFRCHFKGKPSKRPC